MITTIQYSYGFEFNKVRYAWKEKRLFRLPYVKENRSYGFLEIPEYCFKSTTVYNIQKTKKTINKLKKMTKEVDWNYSFIDSEDCPF
jgi:hypothetical protein